MVKPEDDACPCPDDFISTFAKTPDSTVPTDLLEFQYSFGYDVKRLFNLVWIEPDVLVFASGNILTIFKISTREASFRRSANGGGIGFLTKNPNPKYNYLTVAENGLNPKVIIYKFPEFKVIEVLENVAERCFTCVSYDSTGELLATQAGDPDYMLTIWKWRTASIVLKSQSFQNDVLNVVFSPYNPGQLTTCGLGHIKFWKMARTFTGLKLQGELGRFGKTDFSDIYAIWPLADEKVISGCEWGNMLLWDDGLIKFEICRKNRIPCHLGPITYIHMRKGEVLTAGMDGYVRFWFWETVEIADPPEDDKFVEIEPLNEFRIGSTQGKPCEIRHVVWSDPSDEDNFYCYIQDGFGGLWFCDVNVDVAPKPPQKIFHCHGGKVVGVSASPFSSDIVTLCEFGKMHVYNYSTNQLLFVKQFSAPGTDVIWIPATIDPSGSVIIMAFEDGVIRQVVVNVEQKASIKEHCFLINAIKAHAAPITKLSINTKETVLVSGSEEKTIFVYSIVKSRPFVQIVPIGFIELPSIPRCYNWNPENSLTILIGCATGEVFEIELPGHPQPYTGASFQLQDIELKSFQFKSFKSEIRREVYLAERETKKLEKRQNKMYELDKLRLANPGIQIDEDTFLADSEDEEELEPLYYPKNPNPVLFLRYTPESTIWLSMGGYDAGYIYECVLDSPDSKVRATLVSDGDDIEIHSFLQYGKYLVFGMQDGTVRINSMKDQDFRDLSDYWKISMHSNSNGVIPSIETSWDGKYLFTVGFDGGIFVYKWKEYQQMKPTVNIVSLLEPPQTISDIQDSSFLSLEQQKIKKEHDRRMKLANDRKQKVLDVLADYKMQFKEIMKKNKSMPVSQQLSARELELDERITRSLIKNLDADLQLMRRKLAFDVEKSTLGRNKVIDYFINPLEHLPFEISAIKKDISAKSFRIMRLDENFYKAKEECDAKIEAMNAVTLTHEPHTVALPEPEISQVSIEVPDFEKKVLMGLKSSELPLNLNPKMSRLLERYRTRQAQKFNRNLDWLALNSQKPDINKNSDEDNHAIAEAEASIGDYKLKVDSEYEPPETENTVYKYKQLLNLREQLYKMRSDFNKKVLQLRSNKQDLYNFIALQNDRMVLIHQDIPIEKRQQMPQLSAIDISKEYPDINLKPNVEITNIKEIQDVIFGISEIHATTQAEAHTGQCEYILERLAASVLKWDQHKALPPFLQICDEIDQLPKLVENKNAIVDFSTLSNAVPWEIELKYNLVINRIIEQQKIVAEVEERINNFDSEVEKLVENYNRVEIDAKIMEERIMSMNQELIILRDCERLEESIIKEVEMAVQLKQQFIRLIRSMKNSIDENSKQIERIEELVKNVQYNFLGQIKGNKFYDFLRRIFKKKFKPPKEVYQDESESSESESSTSEEEDQASDDSQDIAPIRLDENICPPGCDKRLYDLAFSLRAERHNLEQRIHAHLKQIEELKKKADEIAEKQKDAIDFYQEKKRKLLDFRRERQTFINKIDTLVVLRLDQFQYIKEGSNIGDIKDTLLFDASSVLKLYTRVGQLGLETLATKRLHRVNIVHLQRMTTDCKYMNKQISDLQDKVQDVMFKKFGLIVDLDELEESVLKKFVFEARSNIKDEQKRFQKAMAEKEKKVAEAEKELIKVTQVGTEKINILTVLQEEENFLVEVLQYQTKLYEKESISKHIDLKRDLNKLNDICLRQQQQIEFLEKEIRTLRLRTKPLQQPTNIEQESGAFVEILPPPNERLYEETAYTTLTEVHPPTHGLNPDSTTSEKVARVVRKFFVRTVGTHMPEESIRKYTQKISNYLAFVANNFESDEGDRVVECIVDNFQTMIPHKYLLFIKPNDIKDLFSEVLQVFDLENVVVNTKDVLCGIVSNALEVCSGIKLANFSQEVVTEVFKEIIEVLSMEDLANAANIEYLFKQLRTIPEINPKCINVEHLMEKLVNHARENLLDEFDMRTVRKVADQIIEGLLSYRVRQPKPEKPME